MIVVLDSGPLGMVIHPQATGITLACQQWFRRLLLNGVGVAIPEIAYYEIRRNLILESLISSLGRLDILVNEAIYLPITTAIIVRATELWADARRRQLPTAHDKALDVDMILCAQVEQLDGLGEEVVVATTDVGDLPRFVSAKDWKDIFGPSDS